MRSELDRHYVESIFLPDHRRKERRRWLLVYVSAWLAGGVLGLLAHWFLF